MNIGSVNVYNGSTKYIRDSFMGVNNSITKLASGKKYNSIGEGATEQIMAKSLAMSETEAKIRMDTVKEASRVMDFAYDTLSRLQDILQEQHKIATIASSGNSKINFEELKLQLLSLQDQVKDIAATKYGDLALFTAKKPNVSTTPLTATGVPVQEIEFNLGGPDKLKVSFNAMNDGQIYLEDVITTAAIPAVINGAGVITTPAVPAKSTIGLATKTISVENKANAENTEKIIKTSMGAIGMQIASVVKAKNRLENVEKHLLFKIESLENAYSDIMDVDIAETSNMLVRNILKANTAALAQAHSNTTLRELVLILTGSK